MLETKHSHSPASLVWSNNKTFNTDCKSIYSPYFYLHTIVLFFLPLLYIQYCAISRWNTLDLQSMLILLEASVIFNLFYCKK